MAAQTSTLLSSNYLYAGGLAVTLVAGLLFTGHRFSAIPGVDGISLPTAKSDHSAGLHDGPQEHHRRSSHPHGRPLGLHDLPGPKREFFLGNARSIPRSGWSDAFDSWRRQFGDIFYLQVPNRRIIVLNRLEDAEHLLVDRANIWSGRPLNLMIDELMGFGWGLLQISPGHAFHEMRKILRKVIGPQAVVEYDHVLEGEAKDLVKNLENFEGDPSKVIESAVGAAITKVAYGQRIYEAHGSELIKLSTESIKLVLWTFSQPWLCNLLPITRSLPSWIPGLSFPEYARMGRQMFTKARYWAFGLVKEDVDHGVADPSILSKHLGDPSIPTEYLRDANAMMHIAGIETTAAALVNLIAHIQRRPDVQKKIQDELDDLCGRGNVPNVNNVLSLRYLRAAWKESQRLVAPVPISVPHLSTANDIWKGHHIPQGTIIMCNISFILRDPRVWGPDAEEFKPERFLEECNSNAKQLPDVESVNFGFGRRVCPGRYIAERNGLLYAASILSTYDIVPTQPEDALTTPFPESSNRPELNEPLALSDTLIRQVTNVRCRFVQRY
ncbi:cytochrome P450 [Serendipita vermifera]|nr:cytochrome P450 [Serendipita vermifera]